MLLARKGFRVLLVDRARFPSDIPHGHFMHKHGPRHLCAWGLLDRVLATGCPPSTTITLDIGETRLVGRDLVLDGVAAGYGPRRDTLDQVLIDGAVAAGAELREGFAVEEFISEHDRIVGIPCRDRAGRARVTERAILLGADGRGSGWHEPSRRPSRRSRQGSPAGISHTGRTSQLPGWRFYVRHKRVIFAFPTNDGLFAVFIAWSIGERRAVQRDLERQFMAVIDLVLNLAERGRTARGGVLRRRQLTEFSAPALRSRLGLGG
jgi:2-polyprenyl-6-methoxyphenol hydroxylase-like FAD-dependent oxidoreductase